MRPGASASPPKPRTLPNGLLWLYDPITQIVGYILSGDPTYITSYNNARSLIKRLERDEILEELVRFYVMSGEKNGRA